MSPMSLDALTALKAYSDTTANAKAPGMEASENGGSAFADLVKDLTTDAMEIGKAGEVKATQALTNDADMIDVVSAVSEAELTLETVVSVRDKMIDAYKSIIRMQI